MFRGIHSVSLDQKARMALPARYRTSFLEEKNVLVATIDTEQKCLLLYPLLEWEKIEEKLNNLPAFNAQVRRVQRLLIGHASEIEIDGNGRILLPALLREYAQIDKRIMLVGQGKKFEIWSEPLWQSQREIWLSEHHADENLTMELKQLAL